ncbi:hypothetical protein [Streptomyces sp. NBC_01716]|uniref:hypothetical protein n=1 Tax=Streptomyces sp. NBC_01716 TaxID=2975917 RepID=UPI002E35C0B4|nr:hypothetical protein [Streptomyces sp. NBC_01716]
MTSVRPDGAAAVPLPRTALRYDAVDGHVAPARGVADARRPVGPTRVRAHACGTVRGIGAPYPHRLARTAAGRPRLRSQS